MSIVLGTYTMNAGRDIPGSAVKYIIETYIKDFDYIIVVDGNLTKESELYYQQFGDKLRVADSKWQDSHLKQYKARDSLLNDGDWMLAIDDDEIPSSELAGFLTAPNTQQLLDQHSLNMVLVPSTLYVHDGNEEGYFLQSEDVDMEKGFFKSILYKKTPTLDYIHSNGYHTVPTHGPNTRATKIPYPYIHLKTAESFIINDCHNAFISPENERWTEEEARELRAACKSGGITNLADLKRATISGWPSELIKFAVDHRHSKTTASKFYVWYFFIAKPELRENVSDIKWEEAYRTTLNMDRIERMEKALIHNEKIKVPVTPFLISPYRNEQNSHSN